MPQLLQTLSMEDPVLDFSHIKPKELRYKISLLQAEPDNT
jgi:hypothetical protein